MRQNRKKWIFHLFHEKNNLKDWRMLYMLSSNTHTHLALNCDCSLELIRQTILFTWKSRKKVSFPIIDFLFRFPFALSLSLSILTLFKNIDDADWKIRRLINRVQQRDAPRQSAKLLMSSKSLTFLHFLYFILFEGAFDYANRCDVCLFISISCSFDVCLMPGPI